MFSQDYELGEEISDGEVEAEAGNESSDDDDLKRVLRHIGEVEENVAVEDDFEKSMEDELTDTVRSLERNRGHPTVVVPRNQPDSARGESSSQSVKQTSTGSSQAAVTAASHAVTSLPEIKPKKAVQFKEKPSEFYDPAYFDSDDEEAESSLKAGGARATKKHPVLSDDELFYDPKVDEDDQRWVDEQRRTYHPKAKTSSIDEASTSSAAPPKKRIKEKTVPTTDAVLNCPACMTTVCLDCQRHEVYHQQYRAMFVLNCVLDRTKTLICKAKKQQQKKRRTTDSQPDEFVAVEEGRSSVMSKEDLFYPVKCLECATEVGVIDNDEKDI